MSGSRHMPVAVTATRSLAAGAGIDAHHHDEHQIVYASRGVLSVTTEAGVWITPATRAIWVPAGTVHQHRAHGATVLHMIGLPLGANPLGLQSPAVLAVSSLLRELLIARAGSEEPDSPQGQRLLAVLVDQLGTSAEKPLHLPVLNDDRLAALAAVFARDPGDGRSLAELGAAVGSSARTLSRLFRDEVGMTFPQWRRQVRLQHALELLATGMPVTTVAHRCGWSTPSAFIDVFRATLGHTPGRGLGRHARE